MGKKLLILGGSRYAMPVIEAAHELGHEAITMDYLPDNVAHKYSDGYANVSIADKRAVCRAARDLKVDGIMSFAADPGVVSAAYAAEKLGLPFQGSFEAVETLQNKGLFRSFLQENGFNCPTASVFSSTGEVMAAADQISFPVIVKPTDSAGSKGCTRVDYAGQLADAAECALRFSLSRTCIVEQFIEKRYPSSGGEGFTVDGKFDCISFTSQLFDHAAANPYAPVAHDMPCAMPAEVVDRLKSDLQRLADLLHLGSGLYNIETRIGTDGLPYIMEVAPRGGGNRLSEMLRYASGVDLITAAVQAALGEPVEGVRRPEYDGYWCNQVIHSENGGIFRGMWYADGFKEAHVRDEQLWTGPGARVEGFRAANHAFGTVFLRFDAKEDLDEFHANESAFMKTVVG